MAARAPERIEDYAVIGDLQTAALIGRRGSVDWLCFPRFDSGACFAALLGDESNGNWRIAPVGGRTATRRRYRGETLILETEWDTPEGSVRVTDFMPPRGAAPDLVRIVEGLDGAVPMSSELRIRFDYGSIVPWVRSIEGDLVAIAGPDSVHFRTPVPSQGREFTTYSDFTVRKGDRVPFVLTWHESHEPSPAPVDAEMALLETEGFWTEWMSSCTYDGEWRDAVVRSLITLKGLTYAPTGGIVAAATTSLPEQIGGVRNWDYRYCWLRDATFTLQALLYSGFDSEAKAWREWLLRAIAGDPSQLRIMYGVAGERRLMEFEVPWLPGYENSGPVRVGNAAAEQFQLDVWGEVMDCLFLARESGLQHDDTSWRIQAALMHFLEGNWREPDDGIWEVRGGRQHFVHSKVMAWVAADRAVKTVERSGLAGPVDRWRALRADIHEEVCAKGYDSNRNTFTQYYGSAGLDASLLLIPVMGFLPAKDPRVVGTIEAVQRELCEGGFVKRYDTSKAVDGLPGDEGAFLACTFWLADDLHLIGRTDEARELFERLLDLRNDVGLLAEEYDPRTRRQLGNTPQAFSHVPLVNTAHALSRRTEDCRVRADPTPVAGRQALLVGQGTPLLDAPADGHPRSGE
ncbi:MAG: glycoside hydrolase family 15 protein [Actinomycetota bacterium]|nr:glycoside hydrolase family 15 protein [Actinomycetota bacterium]